MAQSGTCRNSEEGYHSVVSQTEINFVFKNTLYIRTISESRGVLHVFKNC